MTFEDLQNKVRDKVYTEIVLQLGVSYENRLLVKHIEQEIMARLFELSFSYVDSNSISASNLLKEVTKYYEETSLTGDDFDAMLVKARRTEAKYRKYHEEEIKKYRNMGYNIPEHHIMKTYKSGRIYDMPNIFMILRALRTNAEELFELFVSEKITNVKKTSYTKFADAFGNLDNEYSLAKKYENKLMYIYSWVDFYRMELKYHFSLIPVVAEYMCHNEDMPLDNSSLIYWAVLCCGKGMIESYQILRYEEYLSYYELGVQKEMADNILVERAIIAKIVRELREEARSVFSLFHDGNEEMVDVLYKFCHDVYPVIELHKESGFYLDDKGTLNRKKIRYARKFINHLFAFNEQQ